MSTTEIAENRSKSVDTLAGSFYLINEKGDVNRPKSAGVKKKLKPDEKPHKEENKNDLLEASSPFRTVSERTPLMDLNGLLHITPEPLPPLKSMQTCKSLLLCASVCIRIYFEFCSTRTSFDYCRSSEQNEKRHSKTSTNCGRV